MQTAKRSYVIETLLVKSLTLFFVCFLTRVATNKLLLNFCYQSFALEVPMFFSGQNYKFGNHRSLKRVILKRLKVKTLNLELKWDTYELKGFVHNYVNSFFEVLRYWVLKFSIFLWY